MQTSSDILAIKIKTKQQLYNVLAKIYYLPVYNSKAVTKDYLLRYVQKDITIFKMDRKKVSQYHYRRRAHSSMELLEILEKILRDKAMHPTGINADDMPDQQWLCDAIISLDENDPNCILTGKKEDKLTYSMEISEE